MTEAIDYTPEEKLIIESAYNLVLRIACTVDGRLHAHINDAWTRSTAKIENELCAKALVLSEFGKGLEHAREVEVGDKFVVMTWSKIDGLDTAYWIGVIVRMLRPQLVTAELKDVLKCTWRTHLEAVDRDEK